MSVSINIVANYVGRVTSLLSVYLFVPFYVRYLGVDAYGVIAFYTVLLTLTGLADMGLATMFSREAARRQDRSSLPELLSGAERLLVGSIGLCALFVVLASQWITDHWLNVGPTLDTGEVVRAIRWMGLMLMPHFAFSLYTAGLNGLERQVSSNALQVGLVMARSGLVILLLQHRPDLETFFIWQAAAALLGALAARITLLRCIGAPAFSVARFRWAAVRPHIGFAAGVLLLAALSAVYSQLDRIIVSRLFHLRDFGYYSFAATLAQVPLSVAIPIATALYPRLTWHLAKRDLSGAGAVHAQHGKLVAHGSALGACAVALFAPEILALWLPAQSLPPDVAQLTAVLAVAGLFTALQYPAYFLAQAHGTSRPIIAMLLIGIVTAAPLAMNSGLQGSLTGVALSMLVINAALAVGLTAYIQTKYGGGQLHRWLLRQMLYPVVLAAVPLGVLRLVCNRLELTSWPTCILAGVVSAVTFIGMLRRPAANASGN